MNISLKQLRAFVAVAEHRSFTKAAQAIHMTQSTLSVLVRELEDEVGFRLLDRTTRHVMLSNAGRDFHRLALRLLEDFRGVVRETAEIRLLKRGVIRVGAPEAVACSLVIPAIAEFRRVQPEIEVRLVVTMVSSMFDALENGEVDFIVGPDPEHLAEHDASVQAEPLLASPIRAWLHADHPLAQYEQVSWRQLLSGDLIVPAYDFISHFEPLVRRYLGDEEADSELFSHDTGKSRSTVSNITAALTMAKSGLGPTFAAEYVRPLAQAFGLVGRPLVEPAMDRVITLYTLRQRAPSPAATGFADVLRNLLRS